MCVCVLKEEEGSKTERLGENKTEREKERESLCKPQFPDHKHFLHSCMTCIAKCKVRDFSWQHFTFSSLFYCHFQGLQISLIHFFPRCKSPKESLWSASGL